MEFDKRYSLHSREIATRGDIDVVRKEASQMNAEVRRDMAEMNTEITKWCVGTVFAAVGLFAALSKILH